MIAQQSMFILTSLRLIYWRLATAWALESGSGWVSLWLWTLYGAVFSCPDVCERAVCWQVD